MQCSPTSSPATAPSQKTAAPTSEPAPVAVAPGPAAPAAPAAAPASVEAYAEPDAAALKEAADVAVEQTEAAVAAGNAVAAAEAASTLEDVVDDQIALAKEEAVEAVVGLVDAAADAEEAAVHAEEVLAHASETAESVEVEEATPIAPLETAAPATEEPEPEPTPAAAAAIEEPVAAPVVAEAEPVPAVEEPAAVVAVVEEEPTPAPVAEEAAPVVDAAAAVAEEKAEEVEETKTKAEEPAPAPVAAAAAPKSSKPTLPAKKKAGNKKKEKTKEVPKNVAPETPAVGAAVALNGSATKKEAEADAEEEAAAAVSPIPELIPDEPEDQFETLDSIAHPTLNFEGAPTGDDPLNEVENKIRDMSLAAHHLIKDNHNKLSQAVEKQGAALDLALGPEGSGKVRPSLVAACAFALADMLVAQTKVNETRVALATAYDAAQHVENKGAAVRALMNYNYILRNENKPKSAKHAFATAFDIVRKQFGPSHPQVEQVKYEYTGFLAKSGRVEEAVEVLMSSADDLVAEAERLEKESTSTSAEEEAKKEVVSDPGTGLEHLEAAEANGAAAEGESTALSPSARALNSAMRNLLHAGGLLGVLGRIEEAESAFGRAIESAIEVHGENSTAHMEAIYALGGHYRRQGQVEPAIQAHETALAIMDETIEVYEPELLQTRVAILRDTAMLYDKAGNLESAIDYATGALVNAQTLAKIMATMQGAPPGIGVQMVQPYWMLLSDLKAKAGDAEGAAEAKREALKGRLNQGIANRGGRSTGQRAGSGGLKRSAAGGSTRAGGRRV